MDLDFSPVTEQDVLQGNEGILVDGSADFYTLDVKDGDTLKPFALKNTSTYLDNLRAPMKFQYEALKSLLVDVKNPDFKLLSHSLNTRALSEHEMGIYLFTQQTDNYKPVTLDKEEISTLLLDTLKKYVFETESSSDKYKIDFVYYDSHCLPFSLRIEEGKVHVVSVDYIRYPNIVIENVFKNDLDLKDKFIYHYFSPESSMQADGTSCGAFACYALKEISALSTEDLIKMFPCNDEPGASDIQFLNSNLIKLCQVVSVTDRFLEKNPGVKITHKRKEDELLSDYINRHTYKVVVDEGDNNYKLVKTNTAIYKKVLKILDANLKFFSKFNSDKELFEYAESKADEPELYVIKYA